MLGLSLSFTSDIGHFGFSHHNGPSQIMMLSDIFALASRMSLSEAKSHVNLKASLDVKSCVQFSWKVPQDQIFLLTILSRSWGMLNLDRIQRARRKCWLERLRLGLKTCLTAKGMDLRREAGVFLWVSLKAGTNSQLHPTKVLVYEEWWSLTLPSHYHMCDPVTYSWAEASTPSQLSHGLLQPC